MYCSSRMLACDPMPTLMSINMKRIDQSGETGNCAIPSA